MEKINKLKSRINKNEILLIIFIFITVLSIVIKNQIGDLDELWNYNTARAIAEGLIPYKDISMITTPLLPMITSVFLKLIANELIVSRILCSLLWTGILFSVFKILKILVKEGNTSAILTLLIGYLCRNIFKLDYNFCVLLISLIILYKELKCANNIEISRNRKIHNLQIGILTGLAILTKQSIGATLAIIVVIYKIIYIKNKENVKEQIKDILIRIIGILIPVAIFILYLIFTNSFSQFLDYAVLGIKTFSNSIEYITLFDSEKIEIKILAVLVPISVILINAITLIMKYIGKKENTYIKNILTLSIYSLSIIIVMFPISDEIHFLIGSIIPIISIIYLIILLAKIIYGKIKYHDKKRIYKILSLIIMLSLTTVILSNTIKNIYFYLKIDKNHEISHFKSIEINQNLKSGIEEVTEYIKEQEKQGNKVYILDASAAVYMIPIDKYNKDYDMFLKGNIGKNGETGQIEKIKKRNTNELFLVRNEKLSLNWQTPMNVINYIRNNLELIGQINIYKIYK